jgi:hypothetical protein
MIGWVITLQDWAGVGHLHLGEALSVRAIAKRLGIARERVVRAVASMDQGRISGCGAVRLLMCWNQPLGGCCRSFRAISSEAA